MKVFNFRQRGIFYLLFLLCWRFLGSRLFSGALCGRFLSCVLHRLILLKRKFAIFADRSCDSYINLFEQEVK